MTTSNNPKPSPFMVGMAVAVLYRGQPKRIRNVARVTKRFVELSHEGQRYQPDGRDTYPRSNHEFGSQRIRYATEKDVATVCKAGLVRKLARVEWGKLPLETLRRVSEILRQPTD